MSDEGLRGSDDPALTSRSCTRFTTVSVVRKNP